MHPGSLEPETVRHAGRDESKRANAGDVLVVVGNKGVTKRVEHDESEEWSEGDHKKERGSFEAASGEFAQPQDDSDNNQARDEPKPCGRVGRPNIPARIAKNERAWPNEFAEIEPQCAAGDQKAFGQR